MPKSYQHWFKYILLLNLLVTICAVFLSQNIKTCLPKMIEPLSYLLLFMYFPKICTQESRKIKLILGFASLFALGHLSGIVLHILEQVDLLPSSLIPLYYDQFGQSNRLRFFDGITGTAVNAMIFLYLLLGLLLFYNKNRKKVPGSFQHSQVLFYGSCLVLLMIHGLSLYFTYTRSVMVFFCTVSTILIFITVRGWFKWIIPLTITASIIILGIQDEIFKTRVQKSLDSANEVSIQERLFLISKTFEVIKIMKLKELIIGIGPRQSRFTTVEAFKRPENQYLLEFIEKGVLGLLTHLLLIGAYLYFSIKIFLKAEGLTKSLSWAMIGSIVTLILTDLVTAQFRSTAQYILISLAALVF